MILATHLIWSTYGFWMPNEERGSWSTQVWAQDLNRFGPATKVETTRSLAHQSYDRERRRVACASLKYPPVRLTGEQARAVGRGIARLVDEIDLSMYACAVMPDHVHVVVARHRLGAKLLMHRLKSAATRAMSDEGVRPLASHRDRHGRVPTPWIKGGGVFT